MRSLAIDVLKKYIKFTPGDLMTLEKAFNIDVPKSGAQVPGTSGKAFATGNVLINPADGLKLYDPRTGYPTVNLNLDGDAFFGSNLNLPETTSFIVFANNNYYNRENFGRSDVLLGDNTTGKSNMLWDKSAGELLFRHGTTTKLKIDTAGSLLLTGLLASTNYESGVAGFQIGATTGNAEFNDVSIRGSLRSTVFNINHIQATAGTLGVYYSASTASVCEPTVASPTTFRVRAMNDDNGNPLFSTSSRLRSKFWDGTAIQDLWMTVSSINNQGVYTIYTCVLQSGSTGVTIPSGTALVDYGPSGTGNITISADGAVGYSPNINMATHAGSPWSTQTGIMRQGNINGVLGISSTTYGFAVGNLGATSKRYFKATADDVQLRGATLCAYDGSGNASMIISALSQNWGTQAVDPGDVVIGSPGNTSYQFWDRSGGILYFKNSAGDTQLSIGATDGTLYAGGTAVKLNSSGISIDGGQGTANKIKWMDDTYVPWSLNHYEDAGSIYLASISQSLSNDHTGSFILKSTSTYGGTTRYAQLYLSGYTPSPDYDERATLTAYRGSTGSSIAVFYDDIELTTAGDIKFTNTPYSEYLDFDFQSGYINVNTDLGTNLRLSGDVLNFYTGTSARTLVMSAGSTGTINISNALEVAGYSLLNEVRTTDTRWKSKVKLISTTSTADLITVTGLPDYGQVIVRVRVFLQKANTPVDSQAWYGEKIAHGHYRDPTYMFAVSSSWTNTQSIGTAPSAPTLAWSSASSEPSTLRITNNASNCWLSAYIEVFDVNEKATWQF